MMKHTVVIVCSMLSIFLLIRKAKVKELSFVPGKVTYTGLFDTV